MGKRVIIVGGGVAGMKAAVTLKKLGCNPMLIEKSSYLGGELNYFETTSYGNYNTREIIEKLTSEIANNDVKTLLCTEVIDVKGADNNEITVSCSCGDDYKADALVIATGIEWNLPNRLTEFGYGVVDDVLTLKELNMRLQDGELFTSRNQVVKNVALIHCVGSRTLRSGVGYCSRLCCASALKMSIKLKQMLGEDSNVYEFYTDMRVWGSDGEKLYKEACESGVELIRGGVSELSVKDEKIEVWAEDLILKKNLRLNVDMVVLVMGATAQKSNVKFGESLGLEIDKYNYFVKSQRAVNSVKTERKNVFTVGCANHIKSVEESLHDADSVALSVLEYFL